MKRRLEDALVAVIGAVMDWVVNGIDTPIVKKDWNYDIHTQTYRRDPL